MTGIRTAEGWSPGSWRVWLPLAVGALVCAGFHLARFAWVSDDAYISFRYLDNWLAGEGLVYNPGEKVEGYTNLLWILLLAPLRWMGLPPEIAAHGLSLVALTLLLWAVFRTAWRLSEDPAAGWVAMILAAGSVSLAHWAVSGMETVCFAALLALANERLAAGKRLGPGTSVLFGLATLTRPEGALHFGATLGAAVAGPGRRGLQEMPGVARSAAVYAVFPLGHVLFSLAYYGSPLPNTFYAKVTGDLPSLVPLGLRYLWGFLASGGAVLVIASLAALRGHLLRQWVVRALILQVLLHAAFAVWAGGDYFPFHRFLVPLVPGLVVLGGCGLASSLRALGSRRDLALALVVILASALQALLAYGSPSRQATEYLVRVRREREAIAGWLAAELPPETVLAINAAGLVPYRTGFRTIDMLGLNDFHIARAPTGAKAGGYTKIGHFKHDGGYVCRRAPDAVLISDADLQVGRSAREAILQTTLNSFPGDREFLNAPACRDAYEAVAEELAPSRYLVIHVRRGAPGEAKPGLEDATTAEDWFERGVAMMAQARLGEAVWAFQRSLELNPGNPAALLNLGFGLLDLQRFAEAEAIFEEVLSRNGSADALYGLAQCYEGQGRKAEAVDTWRRYIREAPDSVWKERARDRLRLLTGRTD
jgi:hypothetical protein